MGLLKQGLCTIPQIVPPSYFAPLAQDYFDYDNACHLTLKNKQKNVCEQTFIHVNKIKIC